MTARHLLTPLERAHGQRGSAIVRSAQKQAFLWQVRDNLIALARSGTLRSTLRERAAQLNEIGVRTTTGRLLDEPKLSAAMKLLGADAATIKGLQHRAKEAAYRFEVDESEMFDQLWHEWLYHHTRVMIDHGVNFSRDDEHRFIFKPVRPFEWQNAQPTVRDPRTKIWWWGRNKAIPQQARLIYALFGMFEYQKVGSGSKGRSPRVLFP